ncbi:MFS transporter [bacterium]|nr:MFS transporter [bacterium]
MQSEKSRLSLIYVLALSQFAGTFMYSGVGITLPVIGQELQASGVQLGLIEIIYLGAASAFLLPVGQFADLTDRARIYKIGLVFYALTTLALGIVSSVPVFIALRFIQGCAGALIMATNMAILTDNVPSEKLGRAMGMNIGAVYLGLSAGPFIAGWITTQLGWRWVFYITFLPLMASFLLVQVILKSKWKRPTVQIDRLGTLTISTSVFLLIAGSAVLGKSVTGFFLLGAGMLVGGLFFVVEKRMSRPLIDFKSIRENSTLSVALVVQLLMYAGAFGVSFLFSIYLQVIKGLTPQAAGKVLMISPVVMALLSPVCGRLADKFSPKMLTSLGLAFSLVSTLAAVRVDGDTGLVYLMGVLVFQGLSFALFSSPNMTIIMNSVKPIQYGLASALSANMRSLGMVVSLLVVTIFISLFIGKHMINSDPSEFLNVMSFSFVFFSISALIGTFLSIRNKSGLKSQKFRYQIRPSEEMSNCSYPVFLKNRPKFDQP